MTKKTTLDWNEYIDTARRAVAEGVVLIKNDNDALPLKKDSNVAIFGRIQNNYYKSGTGSGGMVNVDKVISIVDGLRESGIVNINEKLCSVYENWELANPFDPGVGWGGEPWSQKEMPLDDKLVEKISQESDTALIIIGRTAGEEQDNSIEAGSYLLTELEEQMLKKTRRLFKKMVVVLNVAGIIDMTFVDRHSPDAVLYAWQGGMIGGLGTADVLTGVINPSGKLTDTIAYNVSDYPSDKYFGDLERNFYTEDIYVGYRYFETFAKDKVRYPFGYGLSYTKFDIKVIVHYDEEYVSFSAKVKNIGKYAGKEVVQVYMQAPQGKLGKASRILCAFAKTKSLLPNEEQALEFCVNLADFASYDDGGVTGNKSCYVLEAGEYKFYVGTDVRTSEYKVGRIVEKLTVTQKLSQALNPVENFKRFKPTFHNEIATIDFEDVPTLEVSEDVRRLENMPTEIEYTGDKGIKLADVMNGKNSMDEFIAQLSDDDLSCIIRGEGMGSPRVTPGTAAAFGGVSDSLTSFGIPCGCCSDGPSGMRLDCGTKVFSLPNGTLLASTFNTELLEELFVLMGIEMTANNIDCLLGPGMNIHRHPLNGRNFEYFSEDPYLTGMIASAELRGLRRAGVTGTIKHFCGNNQETGRHVIDSVISERALREIYLKGFEIAIKTGKASTIMTTYGCVNGLWTAGSYDLTTTILRDEWNFKGIAMTDWWANINERKAPISKNNFAAMARAQNDVYMCCPDGSKNATDDNTLSSLENGSLMRSELQRNARNVCEFLMTTHAMGRMLGNSYEVEIINRAFENVTYDTSQVPFYEIDGSIAIDLNELNAVKGQDFVFALDLKKVGAYRVKITAKSDMGELAQMPVSMFITSIASGTFTFNGTGGQWVSVEKMTAMHSWFSTIRLYFGQSGLTLKEISFEYDEEETKRLGL